MRREGREEDSRDLRSFVEVGADGAILYLVPGPSLGHVRRRRGLLDGVEAADHLRHGETRWWVLVGALVSSSQTLIDGASFVPLACSLHALPNIASRGSRQPTRGLPLRRQLSPITRPHAVPLTKSCS